MADSLWWWGVGKIYKYGENIHAVSYKTISEEMMQKIDKNTTALAAKIKSNIGHVKPGLKTRMFFNVMAKVQRGGGRVSVDVDFWKAKYTANWGVQIVGMIFQTRSRSKIL